MRASIFILWIVAWSGAVSAEALVRGSGFVLTAAQIEAELDYQPDALERRTRGDPGLMAQLINDLYRREAIAYAAKRAGVADDPKAQARLDRARKEELVRIILDEQRTLAAQRSPDFTERARELYKVDAASVSVPERVHVRHILLHAETAEEKMRRHPEASALVERLRGGEGFAALARDVSEDEGSAQKGGDLGLFARGKMVKPFEEAAFALREPGELSAIVESSFGLHILELVDREEAHLRSFEEVEDAIKAKLKRNYVNAEVDAWRREVIAPEKAQVDQAALDAFIRRIVEASSDSSPIEASQPQTESK